MINPLSEKLRGTAPPGIVLLQSAAGGSHFRMLTHIKSSLRVEIERAGRLKPKTFLPVNFFYDQCEHLIMAIPSSHLHDGTVESCQGSYFF